MADCIAGAPGLGTSQAVPGDAAPMMPFRAGRVVGIMLGLGRSRAQGDGRRPSARNSFVINTLP